MKKRKLSVPFILGICLIMCSIFGLLFTQFQMYAGTRESRAVVSQIKALLPERKAGVPETYSEACMPAWEINGKDYVCILEIPEFGVALPVADKWDNKKLYSSPARFCGSIYNNTLVVGGADYRQQFEFCGKIDTGTEITVTDMTGSQFTYTVCGVDRAKSAENQWLTEAECDLTLFCKDTFSMEYISVRCVHTYK